MLVHINGERSAKVNFIQTGLKKKYLGVARPILIKKAKIFEW